MRACTYVCAYTYTHTREREREKEREREREKEREKEREIERLLASCEHVPRNMVVLLALELINCVGTAS